MQCFKLVNAGFVDKVIVFDTLPDDLVINIKTRAVSGFPRAWARWLASNGSVRDVFKTETEKLGPGDYKFKYTPIGKEPCFFILEYLDINADKEAWHRICEYLRMNVGPEVRLKEKVEDMALPMAQKPTDPLEIEPEDMPIVKVGLAETDSLVGEDLVKEGETILVPAKRRGRPKKEAVGV